MKKQSEIFNGTMIKPRSKSSGFFRLLKLPALVNVVLAGTVIAVIPGDFLGLRFSGWGWFIPLLFSMYILIRAKTRVTFPLLIWVPWILFILTHLMLTDFQAIQRTTQLIAPLFIGTAISTLVLNQSILGRLNSVFRRLSILIAFIMVAKTGMLLTGILPARTGLAAEVMISLMFAVYFAASYAVRRKIVDLYHWCVMATMPVFALTRTAIAVTGLTLPLTLGPIRPLFRVVIIAVGLTLATGLFYSERFQSKMFGYTGGQGEISDVLEGDFADHSRFYMWQEFEYALKQNAIWGFGAGEGENFTRAITHGRSQYPHNDYFLTRFDYGWVGLWIYLTAGFLTLLHAFRRSLKERGEVKILFLTGAGAFIPLWMMMGSDNIMVYASFWGNLHFMMLGLAYAATRKAPPSGHYKHHENPSRP